MRLTAKQQLETGKRWVEKNGEAWAYLKGRVARDIDAGKRQPFRLSHYVEGMREHGLRFRNDAAPYVVRLLERETGAQFTKAKSKIDLLLKEDE